MKVFYWDLIWVSNILIIVYFAIPIFGLSVSEAQFEYILDLFFKSALGRIIYYSLSVFSLILWITSLKVSYKNKKHMGHFLALIIFNCLYTPFYYFIGVRKKIASK